MKSKRKDLSKPLKQFTSKKTNKMINDEDGLKSG